MCSVEDEMCSLDDVVFSTEDILEGMKLAVYILQKIACSETYESRDR